jgi:YidC/Oxa1 family membrane protein insertase
MTKMMNLYMPVLMGWLAWSLQSGLAIYFVTTNLIQIAQYAISGNVHWNNLMFWKKTETPVKNRGTQQNSRKV